MCVGTTTGVCGNDEGVCGNDEGVCGNDEGVWGNDGVCAGMTAGVRERRGVRE